MAKWSKEHQCPECGRMHTKNQSLCTTCYYRKHNPKSEASLRREKGLCATCGVNKRVKDSYCAECYRKMFSVKGILIQSRTKAFNNRAKDYGLEPISHADMRKFLEQAPNDCPYCGVLLDSTAEVDHKTPVSRGGTSEFSNLQLICKSCNQMKSDMTHSEFMAKIVNMAKRWS